MDLPPCSTTALVRPADTAASMALPGGVAMAHAFLVGTRAKATGDGAKGGRGRLTSQLGQRQAAV
jgi:hypothetical protein